MTIVTELDRVAAPETLRRIVDESTASVDITPRSLATLENALAHGDLVIAFVDGELAGWGVREPLAPDVVELGFTYTRPEFRHEPVFRALARELVKPPATYVLATYHPSMLDWLAREFGFRETSLADVVRVSRGRFLTKRFSPEARRSIRARWRDRRPKYGILKTPW